MHEGAQGAQRLFEEAQATYDPNNIVAVLQQHPYHIDALLAMFELHRHAARVPFVELACIRPSMAWLMPSLPTAGVRLHVPIKTCLDTCCDC